MSEPVLRVVAATGEVHGGEALYAELDKLRAQLEDAESDIRSWRGRNAFLLLDAELKRQHYRRRGEVIDIMNEWMEVTGRKRCKLTPYRFDNIRDCLEVQLPSPYTREDFSRAIAGLAYDPWYPKAKNGKRIPHNDIGWACRNGGEFLEKYANKAPRGWVYVPRPEIKPGPREDEERFSVAMKVYLRAKMVVAEGPPEK